MNTELTLIRQMEKTLPMVLINEILSYRPAHHNALLIEEVITIAEEALYVDNEDLLNGTFMDMTINGEDEGCFKSTIFDVVEGEGNWRKYCDLVRQDYHRIHQEYGNCFGIWNEEMDALKKFNETKLKMNEIITAITLIENYLVAEPVKQKKVKKAKVALIIEE